MSEYLTIDEETTYWTIACDGYDVRLTDGAGTNVWAIAIYEAGTSTKLAYYYGRYYDEVLGYYVSDNTEKAWSLTEGPNRIYAKTSIHPRGGGSVLEDGFDSVILHVWIYPDRIAIRQVWEVNSNQVQIFDVTTQLNRSPITSSSRLSPCYAAAAFFVKKFLV